jgi:hypothetical protein
MLNRSDESGAIALIAALVSIVLMVVCAFVVDIGGTWARRGQLQVQADRAAVFAADYLPVADASDQKAVAAQVAYYIACHTVEGQRELTSAIPSCTSSTGPSDPAIKTYGDALLTAGQVSFPSATRIKVVTPPARVDFSFGQAAGADGTTQQKTAIAKVGSPGDIVPIGLSMNCMLSVANNPPTRCAPRPRRSPWPRARPWARCRPRWPRSTTTLTAASCPSPSWADWAP